MRTAFVALTLGAWTLVAGGCVDVVGSGTAMEETREVGTFHGLAVSGAVAAVVTIGEPQRCLVRGDDNIVPIVQTEVIDGTLRVKSTRSYRARVPLVVEIQTPELKKVDISGAGDVAVKGKLATERLDLEVSGAGDIEWESIAVGTLTLDVSGAGDVEAKGTAGELRVEVSGAGDASLRSLSVERANVTLSGAGSAELDVSQTLDAKISGAGSIRYRGQPKVTSSISGAGAVKPL